MFHSNGERGITLIEMLLTVAVIAIVGAISIPGLSGWFEKGRLVSEMDRIASRLTLLRQQAIVERRAYRLQLENSEFVTYAYNGVDKVSCNTMLSPTASQWIDLSSQPSAPAGMPDYLQSSSFPQPFALADSGCSSATGLCSYPVNGICVDRSGRVTPDGATVQYVQNGVSRNRITLSATGYLQRQRRRDNSAMWESY